jgi:hypothetical protein
LAANVLAVEQKPREERGHWKTIPPKPGLNTEETPPEDRELLARSWLATLKTTPTILDPPKQLLKLIQFVEDLW